MALKPCKECKNEVSTKAKKCPSCGIKNPTTNTGQTAAQGCFGIIILFGLIMWGLLSVIKEDKVAQKKESKVQLEMYRIKQLPQAKPYQVIEIEDFVAPENKARKRIIAYSSKAKTFEEKAQTVMQIAKDYQKKMRAYEVAVWLEYKPVIGKSRAAFADYYPFGVSAYGDKKGFSLEVWVTDNNYPKEYIKE